MNEINNQLNINRLQVGTLLKTRSRLIGMFTGICEHDGRALWSPNDEIPVSGSFIILSELKIWKNVQGYQILSPLGSSWLIWSDNSKFGKNPEEYVEIVK